MNEVINTLQEQFPKPYMVTWVLHNGFVCYHCGAAVQCCAVCRDVASSLKVLMVDRTVCTE